MMLKDFFDVVNLRRSTRTFSDQPVKEADLQRIFEAINAAPSAGNMQAYEVYVARQESLRQALAAAAHDQDFIHQAPVVLVFCVHPERNQARYRDRGERLYAVQDATIACTHAMLAARALGLGSVWVGAFRDEAVHAAIGSPEKQMPVAVLPIGHPLEWPPPRPRRPLDNLIHELD